MQKYTGDIRPQEEKAYIVQWVNFVLSILNRNRDGRRDVGSQRGAHDAPSGGPDQYGSPVNHRIHMHAAQCML